MVSLSVLCLGCSSGNSCFAWGVAPESVLFFAPSLVRFGLFLRGLSGCCFARSPGSPAVPSASSVVDLRVLAGVVLLRYLFRPAVLARASSLSGSPRSWSSCLGFPAGWMLSPGRICCVAAFKTSGTSVVWLISGFQNSGGFFSGLLVALFSYCLPVIASTALLRSGLWLLYWAFCLLGGT